LEADVARGSADEDVALTASQDPVLHLGRPVREFTRTYVQGDSFAIALAQFETFESNQLLRRELH
jgi:hypothetical protein